MAEKQDNRIKMKKMKGYRGYIYSGFKGVAKNYDKITWDNGAEPKEIVKTPFKTTYKF